ncbi:MAG: type 4a pilus biogenesis protein PilO [Candidatus Paceibacterota bacterium]
MNPNKNYLGAILVSLALIGAWGWVLPEYNKISELNMAINERRALYDSRSEIIKKIHDLNIEYQKRSADITRISSILPDKKSLAEAVSAIEKISTQSGLQLVGTSMSGLPSSVGTYNLMPIELSLSGTYLGLVNFLQSAEKNLRIIDITSIDAASGSTENTLLNFSIKGNAYYLK